MSQSTAEALLCGIIDSPDDDLPRLAYADWCEEQGQLERAELIRTQVERARLPEGDKRAAKLLRREKQLLAQHGPAWCATNLGVLAELRRGFIEHVTCWPHHVRDAGEGLFARFPIRSLCLRVDSLTEEEARELARRPWLARLRALTFSRAAGTAASVSAALAAVLSSSHLVGLRALTFPPGIGPAGTWALESARGLVGLRELDFKWGRIGAEGMRSVARSAHLGGLTRLVLEGCDLGPNGAEALAGSQHLRNLLDLDLTRSFLQTAGVRALAGSPVLATVERLRLTWSRLGPQAAGALARSPHTSRLRELDLNSNKILDAGAEALAREPGLAALTHLSLRKNRLTSQGVAALARATHWQLRRIELGGNALSAEDQQEARGCFAKGVVRM